ncbi:sugar-binding protein [Jiangella rhizosphaerae]|uniref:Carbohydrate-binding domain-containing protein n=1 Tax=Jiangella rhizosphaerae TaxID=2293569 RepID=A0A418KQ38_9ACTN|nr:sugar-binding protein [Jiangella rhizosphaerae]RIQ21460.1 hypothetical protein DY240_15115 [Jiangella rhizosphaerae]
MRIPRRLAAAITAAAAAAAGLVAAPAATQALDLTTTIGDFETAGDGWGLNLGAEFPGAQGSFTVDATDAVSGSSSGVLSGDFTGGGNYVQVRKSISLDAVGLSFQAKTDDVTGLGLRLVDSTGQTHQQRLALTPGGWQRITVTDFAGGSGYLHYGGANDGVWHGPATSVAFIIDKGSVPATSLTGSVRLDAVTVTAQPPALAIEQTTPGNIVEQPDEVTLGLVSRGDTVSWTVTDFWGERVAAGDTPIDTRTELTLPIDTPGHYVFAATATLGGEVIATRETDVALLAATERLPATESPFGLAEHLSWESTKDPDHLLPEIAAKAGAMTVREDAGWGSIEPRPGEYVFGRYDGIVDSLDTAGATWLPMFGYTNAHYDGNATPYTDAGRQAYANYVSATVEHYDLPWVEVYNEFNIGFGDRGDGPADSRADYYFPLLRTTYETVKAEHPDVAVVGGVTSSVPMQWLEQLFQLGGLEYMDVLSVHPYRYPGDPEGMEDVLARLDALVRQYNGGESIPIWITEQGWPTNTGATGVSESTQAANFVRANVLSLASGVERHVMYNMSEKGLNDASSEDRFGIIRHHDSPRGRWVPKPAYVSYATMTRALGTADFVSRDEIAEGVRSYLFDNGGTPVRVLWAEQPATVAIESEQRLTVTDLTGSSERYDANAGRIHLTLGDTPVYVTGDVTSIEVSDTLALRPAVGATVAIGDPVELELTIDNTGEPRAPIVGTFHIGGRSVPVHVAPGRTATVPVTLPAADELGPRELVGTLEERRGTTARLTTGVTVIEPLAVTAAHRLDDTGTHVLTATVTNAATRDVELTTLEWTIGDASGTAEVPATLAGGTSVDVDLPLDGLAQARHAYELRLTAPGVADVVRTGTVSIVADDTIAPIAHRPITVDGVLDDLGDVPAFDLLADGVNQVAGHTGPDDLSGQVWTTWDEENVYLSARIHDDVHSQTSSGDGVWAGDGFQFGFATGLPGETRAWDELGLTLTADGPEVYRWLAAGGRSVGVVEGVDVAVVRHDDTDETVYELAIPWSELTPFRPADRLLSFSLIVNENDGTGRDGWIAWGDGIATAKDPARYLPFRLDP